MVFKLRRRFLTLLEMLVVILLLGLFLGIIGINVNKAVHEQRFRTEVSAVVDMLRIAQNIMLILDNDVHVKFQKREDSISVHIETSCPLSAGWGKQILAPKQLKTIHVINYVDRQLSSDPSGMVDIRFLSSGYVMSQGIMRLATVEGSDSEQGLSAYICLPGYPTPLNAVDQRPKEPDCFSLMAEDIVEGLTIQTVAEIRALQPQNQPAESKDNLEAKPKVEDSAKKA